jgi:hypothetical protein
MVAKKTGTSVKNKALYKRLRNLGVSTQESARVANASVKTPSKKASRRGGAAGSYANWKVSELRARAKKVGIKGAPPNSACHPGPGPAPAASR